MPMTEKRFFSKINKTRADIIVLDLEDSVLNYAKKNARLTLKSIIKTSDKSEKIFVRVNNISTPFFRDDIGACIDSDVKFIIYPKISCGEELSEVYEYLKKKNCETIIIPIVETIKGMENLESIVSNKKVIMSIFGSEDYLAELGTLERGFANSNPFLKDALLNISYLSLKHKKPFIDCATPFYSENDLDKFYSECKYSAGLGAIGKLVIHPNQVDISNKTFNDKQNEMLNWTDKISKVLLKMKSEQKAVISGGEFLIGLPEIKKTINILEYYNLQEKADYIHNLLDNLLAE